MAIVNDVINAGSVVQGTCFDLPASAQTSSRLARCARGGDAIVAFAAERHIDLELLKQMASNLWIPANARCAPSVSRSKLPAGRKDSGRLGITIDSFWCGHNSACACAARSYTSERQRRTLETQIEVNRWQSDASPQQSHHLSAGNP